MKTFEFYNPVLLNFLDNNPNIDLETLIVNLIPFISHFVQHEHNTNDILCSFRHLFSELRSENKHLIEQQNKIKEKYQSEMEHSIKLLEEKQSNMKHIIENNIKESTEKLFNMLKDGNHYLSEQSNKQIETIINQHMSDTYNKLLIKFNEQSEKSNIKIQNYLQNEITPLQNSVLHFTNQFQNSSKKGNMSENKLQNILINLFPELDVEDTSKLTSSGDFILHHPVLGKILIENKCYSQNVRREEVEKFLRDTRTNKCHGILVSQHSGIVHKPHFHIESYDNLINIYIHNMNYDPYLITNAISVIDSVSKLFNNTDHTLKCSKQDLEKVLDEYNSCIENNNNIIHSLQDNIKMLRENTIPSLHIVLEKNLPPSSNHSFKEFICLNCNKSFNKQSSLSQHKRFCKPKH